MTTNKDALEALVDLAKAAYDGNISASRSVYLTNIILAALTPPVVDIEALKREVKDLLLAESPWFEDELLDASIDHLHAQGYFGKPPEGFVMVPIEPTDEMCLAGIGFSPDAIRDSEVSEKWYQAGLSVARDTYKAMIEKYLECACISSTSSEVPYIDGLEEPIQEHFISTATEGVFDYRHDAIVSQAAIEYAKIMKKAMIKAAQEGK